MTTFGQPRRHFAECGSTNDLAREWARDPVDPAPSGALVTADFQTNGRGRRGRDWQARAGQSALMSFVYPVGPPTGAASLSLLTALAVAEALTSLGYSSKIKWPNDILLNGNKVGGILVEVAGTVAVLGIGINVNQEEFSGASGFAYPPTALRLATGEAPDVEAVIQAVSVSLTHWEDRWRQEGLLPIWTAYRNLLAVGTTVRRGEEQAELVDVAMDGRALVRLPDGTFAHWATVD